MFERLSREDNIAKQNLFQGHSDDHLTAYPAQVQGRQMYRETADNRFLKLGKGQELHHKVIIQSLEPCYRGLNAEQSVELTRFIQEELGVAIGNNARNHMPMDVPDHKDIHRLAVAIGGQPNNQGKYMVPEVDKVMQLAANSTDLDVKKACAKQFIDTVQPQMVERIDDLKTARDFRDEVDKGNIFEAIMSLPSGNKDVNQMIEGTRQLGDVMRRLRT